MISRPAPEVRPLLEFSPRTLIRSIIAQVQGESNAVDVVKRNWPEDKQTLAWIQRGAVVPYSTTTSNIPTSTIITALVPLLGPLSAAGNILRRCLNLSFGTASTIAVPVIGQSAIGSFIAQGSPFPIRQLAFSSNLTLTPRKMALGTAFTRELIEHSSAEAVITNLLAADLSLALEGILFDGTAADTTRPAGLKNGISTQTADSGTDITAMFNDLALLASVVAPVCGMNFCYVASPKQAVKIQLRKSQNAFPFPVYASSALADKCVCCLGFDALAVAGDAEPRYETSNQVVLHMEDATPLGITTGGGTPSFASPVQSTWQQDLTAVKLVIDLTWLLRSTSGFSYITAVNW